MKISCDCKDTLALDEITEFQGGLKARSPEEVGKIIKSLKKYGFAFPLFVWKEGKKNWCLDGHGRLLALKKMRQDGEKIPPLPVVYIDAKNETDARNLLLRLNSQYGRMTADSVREFADGFDVDFTELQLPCGVIDFAFNAPQETEGDDDVPDVDEKEEPDSKPGEMYELGNSILMCGDSTNAEDVARLMGGEKADISISSPPYGESNSAGIRNHYEKGKKRIGSLYDDHKDCIDGWADLIHKSFLLMQSYSSCQFLNIQMLADNKRHLLSFMNDFKDYFIDMIVWDKNKAPPQMEACILNNAFEYVIIFGKENASRKIPFAKFHGNKSNILRLSTGKNEYADVHKAVFPVEFPMEIMNLCSEAKTVLDLFGGTGTTLIAAEKLGRKAFLMELSPHYCDIIRRRYTKWAKENGRPITSGCLE